MGRGDPCTVNTVSAPAPVPVAQAGIAPGVSAATGGLSSSVGVVNSPLRLVPRDQRMPRHVVSLGGNLLTGSYEKLVTMLRIREAADHLMSTAEIRIANLYGRFSDEAKFTQFQDLEVNCGYAATGLVKRSKFVTLQPRYVYPEDDSPFITLFGVGQEMRLSWEEKRRNWPKMRESEVAEKIAEEYGWDSDVQDTETLLEDITQYNTTDWHLLDRMARHHGYSVYVENDVLHFHPPRFRNSGIQLMYRGEAHNLSSFIIQGETLNSGARMTFSQIDPLKKETFEVNSQEKEDEITGATAASYGKPVKKSSELVSYEGNQPEHFVYEEGHDQTREYLQRLVEGFSQHTRWLMQGEASLVGLEEIKPRDTIELLGLGKHSGQYYITDTEHLINDDGYTTSFHVARTWEGTGDGGSNIGPHEVQLQQVTS